jgi:phage terminase large subunit
MKFNKKYIPLLDPKVRKSLNIRYIILTGGRGSGKSTAGSHFMHDVSFDTDNVSIYSRFTMTSAKISVVSELVEAINQRNSENFFILKERQIINRISKSVINFKGLKTGALIQTAALKSVTNFNIWFLDEAEELHDESVFDDVDESIRRLGYENLIILSLNTYRISKDHFIYKRFFKENNIPDYYNGVKDNVLYIHTDYLDNISNLDKSFLNIVEKAKKAYTIKERKELSEKGYILKDGFYYNEKKKDYIYSEKYQFRYLGKFRKKAEGAVFDNWGIYKEDPENYDYLYFGGDFGYTNDPTATVEIKIDKVNKKAYIKQHLYDTGLLNSQIAKAMKPILKDKTIIFDSAEAKSISSLRFEHKMNVLGAIKGPDSVRVGINKMKEWELLIHEDSGDIIDEFYNYRYIDKDGLTNEPIDDHNHAIDAIRYVFLKYRL